MARQKKTKKSKDTKTDWEVFAMQVMPLIAEVMAGEDQEDARMEVTLRAGDPMTVRGKQVAGFSDLAIDLEFVVNAYHVRDAAGTRMRANVQITGPVLTKKKKKKGK